MKRGTLQHPKLVALAHKLDVPRCMAVGVLEGLWHFAAQFAPAGDVGRWRDTALAEYIGWDRDPTALVVALMETGWLDERESCRYAVHDWPEHCEDSVHMALARRREYFADGSVPKLSRLSREDRRDAELFYAQTPENTGDSAEDACVRTKSAQEAHAVRTAEAEAEAEAEALALAEAEAEPGVRTVCARPASSGSVSAVLRDMGLWNEKPVRQKLYGRLLAAARDGPEYEGWWREVFVRMYRTDGLYELEDAVRDVEMKADPVQRRAKDLGVLESPGKYLTSRCTKWLHAHGQRMPRPPVAVRGP